MNEQLKIIISAEISKLKANVDEAKSKITNFREEVNNASKNVDEDFAKAGEGIKSGMAIGATAIAGTVTALLALSASTQEYRNEQAKLVTAFETAGASAGVAKDTYNDLYRVLGDSGTATEAAGHLAKLTTEEKALSEWTTVCQGVYATFGDSLPIESLTEAVNHTAKLGEVQGPLADALEWSGVSVEAFNEQLAACSTESEREQLLRETLNGLYGEAAANYEINNAQILAQNEAQSKMNDAMATLGEAMAPVMTMLTELGANVLTAITPYIQSFAENYLPKIQEVLGQVATKLGEALAFMLEHQTVLGVIAGVIATVVTAIGLYNAVAAVKAAMDAAQVTTLGALISVHAAHAVAVMASLAPYIAIAAAIAAVIAIIVVCIKNWDDIKAKIVEVAEKVGAKVTEMKNKVVQGFQAIVSGIKEKLGAAKEFIQTIFEGIVNHIKIKIETAKTIVQNVVGAIKGIFTGDFGAVKTSVTNILTAIADSFKNKLENARNTVKTAIDKIKGIFNFSWSLPPLKIPKISVSGGVAPYGIAGKGSLPKFSITWNALGGVFDKPAIFGYGDSLQGIGEDGAEAVVPLEKNLGWLDKLAGMLNERMGISAPIVLQVDGKTFAQISVDSINQLTKQTGSLPLQLA